MEKQSKWGSSSIIFKINMKLMNTILKIKHCSNFKRLLHIFMKQSHSDVASLKISYQALSLKNLRSESTCQNVKLLFKTISVMDH